MPRRSRDSGLSAAQVRSWFPEDDLLVVPAAALPDGITDPPLRRLLSDVGLPETFTDAVELDAHLVDRVSTIADIYARGDGPPPAGAASLYFLGFAGEPMLGVDGRSGAVYQVHDDFGTRPLAGSLESFLRTLGFVAERARKLRPGRDSGAFVEDLQRRALKFVASVDPHLWPENKEAWSNVLGDLTNALA